MTVSAKVRSETLSAPRVVVLIHKDQRSRTMPGDWIYFGQDFLDLQRWQSILGKASRVSYADLVPVVSNQLRQPFVAWVSEIGKPFGDSLDWWMTPLAGRVVMQTPTFLYLCYLSILKILIEKQDPEKILVIVCEDWFLQWTLEDMLRAAGHRVSRVRGWRLALVKSTIRGLIRLGWNWLLAVRALVAAWIAARRTARFRRVEHADAAKKQIVIHTCIDDNCFGEDGVFHDRYFTKLPAWLESRGCKVTTLPWLCNIQHTFYSAYRWLRQSRQAFIIQEDYLSLSDYVNAFIQIMRTAVVLRGPHTFGGDSIGHLVQRERIENASPAGLRFLLNEPVLKRWANSGNRCDVYIDMFENMYTERPQLAAFKTISPDTLTIGYQHATIPHELAGYSVTADEWRTNIFPQRIVTTGSAASRTLIQQGFPRTSVSDGPALRYSYLMSGKPVAPQPRQPAGDPSMLVVLPLELSASVELMTQLLACREFLQEARLTVWVKVHPMMLRERLMRALALVALPEGWEWVSGAMSVFLPRVAVVLGTGTGALLDAAIDGVPVICLGRELGFAYNPLEIWSDKYATCRTVPPEQLVEKLNEILHAENGYHETLRELSTCIRSGLGELDDSHFSAFI